MKWKRKQSCFDTKDEGYFDIKKNNKIKIKKSKTKIEKSRTQKETLWNISLR